MVHKKEEGTYHRIEKLMKDMPGFLSTPRRGLPLFLIPEYSGTNKEQRIPDRSKTAHWKPPVKCFLILGQLEQLRKVIHDITPFVQKERIPFSLGTTVHPYSPGDLVWVKDGNRQTLSPTWKGPYAIVLTTPTAVQVAGITP